MKKTTTVLALLILVVGVSGFEYSISQGEMRTRCLGDGGTWVDGACKCPLGQRYYGWSSGCGRVDISPRELCYQYYSNWRWDKTQDRFTCECPNGWRWAGNIKGCVSEPGKQTARTVITQQTPQHENPVDSLINAIKKFFGW
ncbi:hypothetical protein DRQ25_04760 [Candidatus Fermentibacteria bacterium]|nr:MAG: hypothetical protein DRQ25_04760 [Candidatus Fermentibacteria bacterium]